MNVRKWGKNMKKAKIYISKMIKISLAVILTFTVVRGLNGVYADQNDGTSTPAEETVTETEQNTESPTPDTEVENTEEEPADDADDPAEDPNAQVDTQNEEEQGEVILQNEPIQYYTVTFFDYDGSQIAESQQVEAGQAAIAPSHPVRDGFEAAGWDVDFSAVNSDLNVTANLAGSLSV